MGRGDRRKGSVRSLISVLLINHDAAVRSSLARLLELEGDLRVYEDGFGVNPDVIVLNFKEPDQARAVRQAYPTSRILGRISFLQPHLRHTPEVDATVDAVAPYDVLLNAIRRMATA